MNSKEEIRQIVEDYFDAINRKDVSSIPLAKDVVHTGALVPEPLVGAEAVRQHLENTAPFSRHQVLKQIVVEDDTAAVLFEFEGLNGITVECAGFMTIRDGEITSERNFFDTAPLMKGPS